MGSGDGYEGLRLDDKGLRNGTNIRNLAVLDSLRHY